MTRVMDGASQQYVTAKQARRLLGAHDSTLRQWANKGLIPVIRTPGGDRRYNVSQFVAGQNAAASTGSNTSTGSSGGGKQRAFYCRGVDNEDVARRVTDLQTRFPDHKPFSDAATRRKGLYGLLDIACRGLVSEVVTTDRDQFTRVSFDLVEWVLQHHGVKVTLLSDAYNAELASDDVLTLVGAYARAAKKKPAS